MSKDQAVILCIDDDPDILDFFKTVLEAEGHQVMTAPTAEEGVKAFKSTTPDLVFVDMMMEEVDAGRNFVKEIKVLGSKVPVYMVTSLGDTLNVTTDYSSIGVRGVLQKPVDIKNLLKIVGQVLNG